MSDSTNNRITAAQEAAGLRQLDLAAILPAAQSYLSAVRTGGRRASERLARHVELLAAVSGVLALLRDEHPDALDSVVAVLRDVPGLGALVDRALTPR